MSSTFSPPRVSTETPRVSVLMPTFKQAAFIRRALESLRAQTFQDWELVIVDDGSPDDTPAVIEPYLADPRLRPIRLPKNVGLGAALNLATAQARGRYLAYLPSDDVYYPDHLARLVDLLDSQPDAVLAYSGLRWEYHKYGPTLQGETTVGREAEALAQGKLLALVQVMHRADTVQEPLWPTRAELETDRLEGVVWEKLLVKGRFAYTGALTCEWVDHAQQRSKQILPPGGLAVYRQHYGVGRDEYLNWQPTRGAQVDERARYGRFAERRELPAPGGLKILLVGELGFNPERILAFEEAGHKLYGLWLPQPEGWDTTGPLPFGNVEDIPFAPGWADRVRAVQPDIVYALLNWQAVKFIDEVLSAGLGAPVVFHFKEGPFICQTQGLWPTLVRLLTRSQGQIFISPENFEWFQLALDGQLDPRRTMILDGDLPKLDWFTDEWAPKLSRQDGEIHTVCTGRPLGLDPFEAIAAAGIHVHFYGSHFHAMFPNWTRNGLATGYMHLHPTVEPDEWVRELSQYDAAWFHVFSSYNGGDLRRAHWDDLNLPARLGTYACAGLPWILKANSGSRVAMQELARQYDVGVFYREYSDLAAHLRDRARLDRMTLNMQAARRMFAFDTYVDELVQFFKQILADAR
ncbi:MAG: glycosyltransferase family 2 protein [Anaerolineae bacterium]|nr:glycosyltransferase family 2 protein [Anaerolineae bacterium]